MESDVPAHLHGVLKERLQNSDKQEAIDLYYELLSSGHSVGEILKAVESLQGNSGHNSSAILQPQPAAHGTATRHASEIAEVGAAEVNTQDSNGLGLFGDVEIRCAEEYKASKKHGTVEIRTNNDLVADNREQRFPESLIRSTAGVTSLEGAHISTGREIAVHRDDQKPFQPAKRRVIGKKIAFAVLYTATVASVAIAGFSVLNNGHNAESTTPHMQQSEIAGKPGAVVISRAGDIRSGSAAAALPATNQIVSINSSHASQLPRTGEPDSTVAEPLQNAAMVGQVKVSAEGSDAGMSQEPEGGQRDTIKNSYIAVPISPESAALPSTTDPTQAAEAGHNPEPATGPTVESAEIAKPALTSARTVTSAPDTSDLISDVAIGAEHDPESGKVITSAANPGEVYRPKQLDTVLSPAETTIAASALSRAAEITAQDRHFKNAEAESLLARGDAFLTTGDLASARLFYESAAAAGNGMAALRLGGTFDPAFLMRARIGRVQGDSSKALYWYRKARDLGNNDAEILLRKMENTTQ